MQDEPNELIREFLNPKRAPTEEEIKRILDHVAKAPFRSAMTRVKKEIQGQVFLGRELRTKEPSIIAHLAKRVLSEEQLADGTTPDQYLEDLRSVIGDPELRLAVYARRGQGLYLGCSAPNRLLASRLGRKPEPYLWVVYSTDYGTIMSGYQGSALDRVSLPEEVRWL